MKFLKRDKAASDLQVADDLIRTYSRTEKTGDIISSDDISFAQSTVDHLADHFKVEAEAQQIAIKRMSALTRTITKMETRLRQLDRVEIDNQKLSRQLDGVHEKIKRQAALAEERDKTLLEVKRQRDDFQRELDHTKTSLSKLEDRDEASCKALLKQSRDLDALKTEVLQKDETIQNGESLQQRLKDELSQIKTEVASERARALELQKSTEELSSRLAEKTRISDKTSAELKTIQARFNDQKERLFALKGELQSLNYSLTSDRSDHEDKIRRRDDEILTLKNQIDQLNIQLRIKDNMVGHFDDERADLRRELDSERSRAVKNGNALAHKIEELDIRTQSLSKSKAEYEQLQSKFSAAIDDLDSARKLIAIQKQKLERYAAISGGATGEVFIHQEESGNDYDFSPRLKAVN